MKFEKAPDDSQIRRAERPLAQAHGQGQVHLEVEEEAQIHEMEGGLDPQRDFEQREPEFVIPPLQSKGVQFEATFSEPMMSEPTYTAGLSSQPSFTEPPHIETSPHQAPHTPDHASWMDLLAQINSLGTRMEELAVGSDTQFYSMEDRMDQYQIGFTSQFEYVQQRFERMEDRMDQQQVAFGHLQQRIESIESIQESQYAEIMA